MCFWVYCTHLLCLQPAVHVQGQEPLTASMLAAALPQEQKQMLGKECCFSLFVNPTTWRNEANVSFSSPRWASLPTYPEYASQPGWQDHRYAAGNRQLGAPPHAGVPRVFALQGWTRCWTLFLWTAWNEALEEVFDVLLTVWQVDEAVAVLQAHQAKEAAQKTVINSSGVPNV